MLEATFAMREREQVQRTWTSALASISDVRPHFSIQRGYRSLSQDGHGCNSHLIGKQGVFCDTPPSLDAV